MYGQTYEDRFFAISTPIELDFFSFSRDLLFTNCILLHRSKPRHFEIIFKVEFVSNDLC